MTVAVFFILIMLDHLINLIISRAVTCGSVCATFDLNLTQHSAMDEADKAAIAAALQDSWRLLSPFSCFAVCICFLLVLNHFEAFGARNYMKTKNR